MNTTRDFSCNRWHLHILILSFCILVLPVAATVNANVHIPAPQFTANFNGNTTALLSGKTIKPIVKSNLSYQQGVRGQGIYVGGTGSKRSELLYNTHNLFKPQSGTLMFWFRPAWDGKITTHRQTDSYHHLISAFAGPIQKMNSLQRRAHRRLNIFLPMFLRCDLYSGLKNGKHQYLIVRRLVRHTWHAEEWEHVAVTWSRDGAKLYSNGLLYAAGQKIWHQAEKGKVNLSSITQLAVGADGTGFNPADGTFDELRVYNQALTAQQIALIYHQAAIVDVVVGQRFVLANHKSQLAINIYAAGKGQLPAALKPLATIPEGSTICFYLTNSAGKKLLKPKPLNLPSRIPSTVKFNIPEIKPGKYTLYWDIDAGKYHITKAVTINAYTQRPASKVSDKSPKLGHAIVNIDCTKTADGYVDSGKARVVKKNGKPAYREAGPNDMDRFSYVIHFPKAAGHPVMLEVTWPDDKPRAMALYMYRDTEFGERRTSRDRLEAGIQSGMEYPATDKMITTGYLFYPWVHKYLFEARTKIKGYPAAVASIKVRPVIGRLPKLAINTPPQGLTQRHFGDIDEDQSFARLLVDPGAPLDNNSKPVRVLEELLDYMDYTGQDTLAYAFERYGWTYTPYVGESFWSGLRGHQKLMLDMFERRGKRLWAVANIFCPVGLSHHPELWKQSYNKGVSLIGWHGQEVASAKGGMPAASPASFKARTMYMQQIRRMVKRYAGEPALAGVELWITRRSPLAFPSLKAGYGDVIVKQFERDTGKTVKTSATDKNRFMKRYKILTGPMRKSWLRWRARQVTGFIRQITATVDHIDSNLPVRVSLLIGRDLIDAVKSGDKAAGGFTPVTGALYRARGIDVRTLKTIPGVTVVPVIRPTLSRWKMHRSNGIPNSISAIFKTFSYYRPFKNDSTSAIELYNNYFESFNNSLKPKEFPSYFQNADVKRWGKFFLGVLTRSMAQVDADQVLIGGQPLGTAGRDKQAREFAQAYRALPAGEYMDIAGSGDPVIARTLWTAKGAYSYLVNLIDTPVKINLTAKSDHASWLNLATNKQTGSAISLEPFQLISLRGPRPLALKDIVVPKKTLNRYWENLHKLKSDAAVISKSGVDIPQYQNILQKIAAAINSGSLYKAHNLIFSKQMLILRSKVKSAGKGYLKTEMKMIRRGRYAVDCGSPNFYVSGNGALFFPDQQYHKGGYGYVGPHISAGRSISRITNTHDPKLFATEAYNFDGYRFTVPDGCYKVKLYFRVGYEPHQKPGFFIFNLSAEGKRIVSNYDVFVAQHNNPDSVAILTIPKVQVTDGVLKLTWSVPPGISPSARLVNAIVVKPVMCRRTNIKHE